MFYNIIEKITPYWPHLSILVGIITAILGLKIVFSSKFLKLLMSKGRMWEYEENKIFTEKGAQNYNRGRGMQIALVGITFTILGISALLN